MALFMKQAIRKSKNGGSQRHSVWGNQIHQRIREGQLILFCTIGLFFLVSLSTYSPADPGWSHPAITDTIANAGGWVGAWFADITLLLLGYMAYAFPLMLGYTGWTLFHDWRNPDLAHRHLVLVRIAGFSLIFLSGTALLHLHFPQIGSSFPVGAGGALGVVVSQTLVNLLSYQGTTLILLALALVGITLGTGLSWIRVVDDIGKVILWMWRGLIYYWDLTLKNAYDQYEEWREEKLDEEEMREPIMGSKKTPRLPRVIEAEEEEYDEDDDEDDEEYDEDDDEDEEYDDDEDEEDEDDEPIEPHISKRSKPVIIKARAPAKPRKVYSGETGLPSVDLLDESPVQDTEQYTATELEQMSRDVEKKLADFGVSAQVVGVMPGPVITRFELSLAPGIKVSKIVGLAKDLARSLSIVSVRVVEVIPGKPYVGLELPNRHRETVSLREVLSSEEYEKSTSPVTLALGKDIAGNPVVVDLAKMPHVLVAGTTGSGKSVGVNSMLLSLLFKSTPEDVRMILIDPKMLELSVYEGIPHLLCPVVIDMKEAANALTWCVAEMERRYRIMAALGVRNMASYNRKVKEAAQRGEPIRDPSVNIPGELPPALGPFANIVVVIDEFADMMMVVGKKVEELIARIAQKARAAGIHLILATQRPSVDVITGLIKANIPTRIAFQVASRIDSRTILDQQGAEQLLGRGDMLYLPAGAGVPVRVHGAFVADQEVHSVVHDWKQRAEPQYDESIIRGSGGDSGGLFGGYGEGDADRDPLYDDAVRIVTESRRASISNIQRRLKIGYNRAARLVEEMELAGIVSPMQNNGSREILVSAPPTMDMMD